MSSECKGILNPLTGVCVEKNGRPLATAASASTQSGPASSKTVQLDDYRLGSYCEFMKNFNENPFLTEMAYAYDAVFNAVEKVDQHTVRHLAHGVGFEDTFQLATAATYGATSFANLAKLGSSGGRFTPRAIAKAMTVDAYRYGIGLEGWFQPFKIALMAQLMFSGFFSAPGVVVDDLGGKELTGPWRTTAYWGTFGTEVAAALWMFGDEYSKTFDGRIMSRSAKWIWTGVWALYSAYMYGRTDQREYYRLRGEDPRWGDNPLKWTRDGYNPNRYSSDWAANFIGGAVFWGAAPQVGRRVADKAYEKLGMPDFFTTGYKFSTDEKKALLAAGERTYLAQSTLKQDIAGLRAGRMLRRLWLGTKYVGRVFRTAGLRRFGYALLHMASTTGVVSIPLSRISQIGRKIEEDEYDASREENECSYRSSATLHGVSNRTALSAVANAVLFMPFRLAGFDPSRFLYYAPGMALNVYPANSCNEYRGVPNQMALVHLERYRQATTPEQKRHERALFRFNFALANPEDQEKAIKEYTQTSYPQEVRNLFEPFVARGG
ncbi:MAG: hypothetical protein HY609_05035 [Deltaproteobacteria bacterium]|nr:hypothetical protein [Deltaproteobacteria bacterium]MBI4224277.1 hypothetical protein [Deltaproteobacteria bacterium]